MNSHNLTNEYRFSADKDEREFMKLQARDGCHVGVDVLSAGRHNMFFDRNLSIRVINPIMNTETIPCRGAPALKISESIESFDSCSTVDCQLNSPTCSDENLCPSGSDVIEPTRVVQTTYRKTAYFARWWQMLYGRMVTPTQERDAEAAVASLDMIEESPHYAPESCTQSRVRRNAVVDIVDTVRLANPGITVDTEANRLVARDILYKSFKEAGWRITHIKRDLPIALEMVFVPNYFDLEAQAFKNSRVVIERKRMYNQNVYSRQRWSLFNWIGKMQSADPVRAT